MRLRPVLAAAAFALVLAPVQGAPAQAPVTAPGTRTIFVSATGDKNAAIRDLTPAEFVVKENGTTRQITAAAISRAPMHVVLMLDNSGLGLGAIRQGAGLFVETLQGQAEFAIMTLGASNQVLVDFSKDPPVLYSALQTLLARNSPPAYVLDGLMDASRLLMKKESDRPVIVLVASEVEELSTTRAEVVLDALQKSGARFYYVGMGAPLTRGTRPALTDNRADASTEDESTKRNAVIGAGPKNSGGRSEQVLQTSGVTVVLKGIADELSFQYAVTYVTDAADAKLSVETTRKGVKLRAPARVHK